MKKYLFILLAIPLQVFSQANDQKVASNYCIFNTCYADNEPFIAVNPANSQNVIAAWMSPVGIRTAYSMNGGLNWTVNAAALPHAFNNGLIASADVSIAFNKTGTAFLSYVDYKYITLDSGYVRVTRSTDGGATWSSPVNAIDGTVQPDKPIDRPWIVCDNTNGTYSGRIYLVSKSYFAANPPHKIWMSVSTDNGNTFSPITRVDNPVQVGLLTNIMGVPAIGADGALYIAYLSWDTNFALYARVVCVKSTDGGSSFTPYQVAVPAANSGNLDSLYQGSYSIAANPADTTNLVFQVTDNRNGDPDILTVFSNDGGQTWSASPVRVNDDALSNGIGQDMSWAAFSPNGTYAVAWRDRRNSGTTDTAKFEIYAAVSADGGQTFKPNFRISSQQSRFINIQRGNDFIGVCMNGPTLFSDWADNRNWQSNGNRDEIYARFVPISQLMYADELHESTGFRLFPDPAHDLVTLVSDESGTVTIFNLLGEPVRSLKVRIGPNTVNVMELPAGTYFVQVVTSKGTVTRKLQKQ